MGLVIFYGFGNYMGVYFINDEFYKTFDIRYNKKNKKIKWYLIEIAAILALTGVMHLDKYPKMLRTNEHILTNSIRSIIFNFLGGFMNTYGLYTTRKLLKKKVESK